MPAPTIRLNVGSTVYIFPILGQVQRNIVQPFSAALGSSNSPVRSDYQPTQSISFEEFQGLGNQYTDGRSDLDTAWDADTDMTDSQYMLLAPLTTDYTERTGIRNAWGIFKFKAKLYTMTDGGLYEFVSSDWSAVTGTPTNPMYSAAIHKGNVYIACASGDGIQKFTGTAFSEPHASQKAKFILDFDSRLLIVDDTDTDSVPVLESLDEGLSWTTIIDLPTSSDPKGLVTWLNRENEPTPAVFTDDGMIYMLDIYTRKYYAEGTVRVNPTAGAAFGQPITHAGNLLVPGQNMAVTQISPTRTIVEVGPGANWSVPNSSMGDITFLYSTGRMLYATTKGIGSVVRGALLVSKGGLHWAKIASGDDPYLETGPMFYDDGIFYFWRAKTAASGTIGGRSFQWPESPRDIQTGHYTPTYNTGSTWYSPIFNGGFSEFPFNALSVALIAESLSSTETVKVEYMVFTSNAWGSWTTLATYTNATTNPQKFASGNGVACDMIRFRLTLVRGTTTTVTPKVLDLTFHYLPRPVENFEYIAQLNCIDHALTGVSGHQLLTNLETLISTDTLLDLRPHGDSGETARQVEIKLASGSEFSNQDLYARRQGVYTIRLVEHT